VTRARSLVDRFARRGCPPGWQLTRAVSEEDLQVAAHLDVCQRCAGEVRRLREVVDRVSVLPAPEAMSHESRQNIAARLRVAHPSASRRARSVRIPLGIGALALAGLAVAWGLHFLAQRDALVPAATQAAQAAQAAQASQASQAPPKVMPSRAAVRAVGAARFTRTAPPPDERLRLDEGTLALDVVALSGNERFRVVTSDAEVEVRGTHFEVSAVAGSLTLVRVSNGRVVVRSVLGALAVLEAGDEWVGTDPGLKPRNEIASSSGSPPSRTEPVPSARVTRPSVSRAIAADLSKSRPNRNPKPNDSRNDVSATASFDRAWSLLRHGQTQAAAAAFAEVERQARGSPIEEDAAYWRAVAVARSGDSGIARRLFGEFLRRFPESSRAGEAALAFGWLLLEAGDLDQARSAFERAARDASAPVRARALDGLRAIHR
jgi:TolA-binding protein